MGTKWMIEDVHGRSIGSGPLWWTGDEWSTDCYKGLQFETEEGAKLYMEQLGEWPSDVVPTEHIFMSPISTEEKLN